MLTDAALLKMAVTFEITQWDSTRSIPQITVELRRRTGHPDRWVIASQGDFCLTPDGDWVRESLSSRLNSCYWEDLHAAVVFAKEHIRKYPCGYKPPCVQEI